MTRYRPSLLLGSVVFSSVAWWCCDCCFSQLPLLVQAADADADTVDSSSSSSWYRSWFVGSKSNNNKNSNKNNNNEDDDTSFVNVLKSPLLNRELTTTVKAHGWPTLPSNALCEAMIFFQQEDFVLHTSNTATNTLLEDTDEEHDAAPSVFATEFLNLLTTTAAAATAQDSLLTITTTTTRPALTSWKDGVEWALEIAHQMSVSSSSSAMNNFVPLLDWSLQLRANSPLCELHRGLARETLQQAGKHQKQDTEEEDGMVLVLLSKQQQQQQSKVLTRFTEVVNLDWTSWINNDDDDVVVDVDDALFVSSKSLDQYLLPGELSVTGNGNANTFRHLIILYGELDSLVFAQTYRFLQDTVTRHNNNSNNTTVRVPMVVRFLGAVHYENDPTRYPLAQPTTLAGYGVRLDIRNVEYKVFDEKKKSAMVNSAAAAAAAVTDDNAVMVNLSSSSNLFAHDYLAGVNLTHLLLLEGDSDLPLTTIRNRLWNQHEQQQLQAQKIPPLWQRRQLPLQAATALLFMTHKNATTTTTTTTGHFNGSGNGDVLVALMQLSQDLPSLASTLVQIKISPLVHEWASACYKERGRLLGAAAAAQLYINGRPSAAMDRPSFNVFELLNVVRMEERRILHLQKSFWSPLVSKLSSPALALARIHQAWISGSEFGKSAKAQGRDEKDHHDSDDDDDDDNNDDDDSATNLMDDNEEDEEPSLSAGLSQKTVYRIDVGRGWKNALLYVNDVEKDPQYRQWTRSLQQMLISMQFGMAPSIRRNMYTMTLVVDPTDGHGGGGALDLAVKLIQNQYPIRLALLVVDDNDVQKCKAWLHEQDSVFAGDSKGCPVLQSPIIETGQSWSDTPATGRAVHRLVNFFVESFGTHPGASLAYVEYLFSLITERLADQGRLNLQDLINIHVELLQQMGLGYSVESDAKNALLEQQQDLTPVGSESFYEKALRFAAERSLRPGMGFLNGRPLPTDEAGVYSVFRQEQNYIVGLIMAGEITDQNPKSVYGKLLSGPNIFPQMHPLFLQDEDSPDSYQSLKHSWDSSSFLLMGVDNFATAYFVMDVVLDYATPRGLAQLDNLLENMEGFPTSFGDEESKKSVSIGYRVLPSSKESAASPLCPIFANAASVGLFGLQRAVKTVMESSNASFEDLILQMDDATKELVKSSVEKCSSGLWYLSQLPENDKPLSPRVICNGRVYHMEDNNLVNVDIDLLVSVGKQRASAVLNLLKDLIPKDLGPAEVAEVMAGVSLTLALEQAKKTKREDVMKRVYKIENRLKMSEKETGLMRFHWNEPTGAGAGADDQTLKSRIIAVLDPVHITTQRLAPLLLVLRDQLKLPMTVVLAPAPSIDGDATVPVTSYYRFVAGTPGAGNDDDDDDNDDEPMAHFSALPLDHVLTLRMDVPEPWDVQQTLSIQDTDNLRCDLSTGCGDDAHERGTSWTPASIKSNRQITRVEYGLDHLLLFGQCYENKGPPNGLQLVLHKDTDHGLNGPPSDDIEMEVSMDGEMISTGKKSVPKETTRYSDTLVMKNVGYWQLRANPGVWEVAIDEKSKGAEMFDFADGKVVGGRLTSIGGKLTQSKKVVLKDFASKGEMLYVKRRPGYESASLFFDGASTNKEVDDGTIHVFSLATGHLYERFLKIMMLSVTKRTSSKVKFWFFQNFLSPTFKDTSRAMAERIGCEVEFVTYKWPEWLRGQTEKQRIIWGYKILFLDVLFPLDVKKIIYVDADQVLRADLKELWDMDLQGAPYAYTPMCSSRNTTIGYQFWRDGFWKTHLQGKPYHISALYVVDLKRFREELVGDQLRSIYQQLSADPNSLANLDQDLPNYAQHQVPIFSLPQDWLWCESWCSDETKATSKTIDLCNNPLHKEPKVSMAKRVIDGPLFNESWVELDAEVERYESEYLSSLNSPI